MQSATLRSIETLAPEADALRERLRRILAECVADARAILAPTLADVDGPLVGELRIPAMGGHSGGVVDGATSGEASVVALARDLFQARLRAEGLA